MMDGSKVNNKDNKAKSIDFLLMSFLLTFSKSKHNMLASIIYLLTTVKL